MDGGIKNEHACVQEKQHLWPVSVYMDGGGDQEWKVHAYKSNQNYHQPLILFEVLHRTYHGDLCDVCSCSCGGEILKLKLLIQALRFRQNHLRLHLHDGTRTFQFAPFKGCFMRFPMSDLQLGKLRQRTASKTQNVFKCNPAIWGGFRRPTEICRMSQRAVDVIDPEYQHEPLIDVDEHQHYRLVPWDTTTQCMFKSSPCFSL